MRSSSVLPLPWLHAPLQSFSLIFFPWSQPEGLHPGLVSQSLSGAGLCLQGRGSIDSLESYKGSRSLRQVWRDWSVSKSVRSPQGLLRGGGCVGPTDSTTLGRLHVQTPQKILGQPWQQQKVLLPSLPTPLSFITRSIHFVCIWLEHQQLLFFVLRTLLQFFHKGPVREPQTWQLSEGLLQVHCNWDCSASLPGIFTFS